MVLTDGFIGPGIPPDEAYMIVKGKVKKTRRGIGEQVRGSELFSQSETKLRRSPATWGS